MNCWICGKMADSREHLFKASDIKLYFPKASQKAPIYYNDNQRRNYLLKSRYSNKLKSDAPMCKQCNNERTQPYDFAWEKFSRYLSKHEFELKKAMQVELKKIYPGSGHKEALNLFLYFIKLSGCHCYVIDHPKKDEFINDFSNCILQNKPSKYVYLSLNINNRISYGISEIKANQDNMNRITKLVWAYYVGWLRVEVHVVSKCLIQKNRKLWSPLHERSSKILLHESI